MTRDNNVVKQTIAALPTQRFSHSFSRISGACTFYANSSFMYNNTSSRPPTNQTCTFKNIECKVGITRKVQMHEELFCLVRSRQNHAFLGALLATGQTQSGCRAHVLWDLLGAFRSEHQETTFYIVSFGFPIMGPPSMRFETSHRRDGPN